MSEAREVHVQDADGQPLASATLSTDDADIVRASLHVGAGPLPPGTRTRLVDKLLEQPETTPGTEISAALPAGDCEIIERLQERTTDTAARRAGASTIIDGRVLPPAT